MNKLQRLERLEAKRRRVTTGSSDIADAAQQFWAKLDALGARLRAAGEVPAEITTDELSERIAMVKEDLQRAKELAKQPKAANWLKLQRKGNSSR